jgi:hypothetical protein
LSTTATIGQERKGSTRPKRLYQADSFSRPRRRRLPRMRRPALVDIRSRKP